MPTKCESTRATRLHGRVALKLRLQAKAVELEAKYRREWPPEHHGRIRSEIAAELERHESQVSRYLKAARIAEADTTSAPDRPSASDTRGHRPRARATQDATAAPAGRFWVIRRVRRPVGRARRRSSAARPAVGPYKG